MMWFLMAMMWLGEGDPAPQMFREEQFYLRMPKAIMEDPGLREHLLSGLTTTFHLIWSSREKSKPIGGIRMDIRYEPWDEVFFLNLLRSDGVKQALEFPSQDALVTWWGDHRFFLFGPGAFDDKNHLWITLRVIPFSQQEQQMAREWLTPQNSQPDSGLFSGRTGGQRTSDQQRQNNLLRIMFATSIQREAIKSYRWKIKIP